MKHRKKRFIATLCIVALLATFLGTAAFAYEHEPRPFNATFNGYSGTQTAYWGEKIEYPDEYAYIHVSGYSASSGNTSVGFICKCGDATIHTTFSYVDDRILKYPFTPADGSYASLTINASTGIIGVGGYWRPY